MSRTYSTTGDILVHRSLDVGAWHLWTRAPCLSKCQISMQGTGLRVSLNDCPSGKEL